MKETHVIQKVADAESAFNVLIEDYNKLLEQYKAQTSFAAKIKQAVLVKKVDVAIYNILNTTTALIKYSVLKSILSADLAKHYTQLFKSKFNEYKTARESAKLPFPCCLLFLILFITFGNIAKNLHIFLS